MKVVREVQETKKSAKRCKVLVCAQALDHLGGPGGNSVVDEAMIRRHNIVSTTPLSLSWSHTHAHPPGRRSTVVM